MNKFLVELADELRKRKLYKDEIDEIIAYYEEIIADRVDHGEKTSDIIEGYDVKAIARLAYPNVLSKRTSADTKVVGKNIWDMTVFLLSTPGLILIGIIYLVFVVVMIALVVSAFAVMASGIFGAVALITQLIMTGVSIGAILVVTGAFIIGMSMASIILLMLTKGIYYVLKGSVSLVGKKVGGGKQSETNY